ncbi:MAG: hypothetical protein ABIQ39_07365, partial [Ilumatobacteraceae bacterium]
RAVNGELCPDGSLYTTSVTTKAAPGVAATAGATVRRDASGEATFTWSQQVTGIHTFSSVPTPVWNAPPWTNPQVTDSATAAAGAVRLGPPPATVTCTVAHTVFFPDPQAIAAKATVAMDAGWGGIVIWAASYETDAVYTALSGIG